MVALPMRISVEFGALFNYAVPKLDSVEFR